MATPITCTVDLGENYRCSSLAVWLPAWGYGWHSTEELQSFSPGLGKGLWQVLSATRGVETLITSLIGNPACQECPMDGQVQCDTKWYPEGAVRQSLRWSGSLVEALTGSESFGLLWDKPWGFVSLNSHAQLPSLAIFSTIVTKKPCNIYPYSRSVYSSSWKLKVIYWRSAKINWSEMTFINFIISLTAYGNFTGLQ